MEATLNLVLSALVVLVCFHRGRTLQCLSCDEVLHPRYCDVTATCDFSEVCYAESFVTRDGVKAYTLGCSTQDVCSDKAVECSECCNNTDLCNSKVCGEAGYPSHRGPICYSCDSRPDSQPCNVIHFCENEQVCSISGRHIFSEMVYTTGCSQKQTCSHSSIIVGRRNAEIETTLDDNVNAPHYHRCCSDDLCNIYEARDCLEIKQFDSDSKSGVYKIRLPQTSNILSVLCDMDTDGGGWTVFQKRFNGSVDFYRTFSQYENGFGNIDGGEFWLGLRNIYELSSFATTDLRIDLENSIGSTVYGTFHNFSLKPAPKYTLHADIGFGTTKGGTNGLLYSRGNDFFTFDHDNSNACAVKGHGGWWYLGCTNANLNGHYLQPPGTSSGVKGMFYFYFDNYKSLKSTKMMLRRAI